MKTWDLNSKYLIDKYTCIIHRYAKCLSAPQVYIDNDVRNDNNNIIINITIINARMYYVGIEQAQQIVKIA